jgi:hypothetical protein
MLTAMYLLVQFQNFANFKLTDLSYLWTDHPVQYIQLADVSWSSSTLYLSPGPASVMWISKQEGS